MKCWMVLPWSETKFWYSTVIPIFISVYKSAYWANWIFWRKRTGDVRTYTWCWCHTTGYGYGPVRNTQCGCQWRKSAEWTIKQPGRDVCDLLTGSKIMLRNSVAICDRLEFCSNLFLKSNNFIWTKLGQKNIILIFFLCKNSNEFPEIINVDKGNGIF